MTRKEELNKKLAEWAGFKEKGHPIRHGLFWVGPNGNYRPALPNFPEDETACFKHLVPKLFKNGQGGIEFNYYPGGLRCVLTTQCEAGFEETESFDKEFISALALCLAIEKLIDEEKE